MASDRTIAGGQSGAGGRNSDPSTAVVAAFGASATASAGSEIPDDVCEGEEDYCEDGDDDCED